MKKVSKIKIWNILFYEKLVEGYSKHDAYISTVLTMKERYPDANYWASFVLLE